MALLPENAPDSLIAKLCGDDLNIERAAAAAIDRVNELMKPATTIPELFFSGQTTRRNMAYDRVPVGHNTGYRCYNADKHDSESAFESGEYGDGLTKDQAYVAWLNDSDPAPRPRLGTLVNGGSGVEPPEYAPYRETDPDVDFDDGLTEEDRDGR